MPYLDSKIDKHYKNCINPVGKRLYIRDYDDNGKQKFVSWGLTCTTCGVVVKEKYQHGLTPKQLRKREMDRKLEGSKYAKTFEKLTGRPYASWKERFERSQKYKVMKKLKRLQRRRLGKDPMTPQETGLRRRIRGFKNLYYIDNLYWSLKDENSINWSEDLSERFLNITPRPTINELVQVIKSSPLGRYNNGSLVYRNRGYVPNPDKEGWLKYDKEAYKKLLKSEAQKRIEIMEDIIKSREVKQNE